MKKLLFYPAPLLAMLVLLLTFTYAGAQSENALKILSASDLKVASEKAAVTFQVSIPGDYTSSVTRQNAENAVYFNFKKSDGTTQFLFQVNRISEYQWLQIKDQLSHSRILDHKNGFIYYALPTDKYRINGPDSEAYQQVYVHLNQIINTIAITENMTASK
jgi:hypothetical protein